MNTHSTLWYSYTDDLRGTLIFNIINNSNHISLKTYAPTRVPNIITQHYICIFNTLQQHNLKHQTFTKFRPLTNIHYFSHRQQNTHANKKHSCTNYNFVQEGKVTEETEVVLKNEKIPTHLHNTHQHHQVNTILKFLKITSLK